MRWMRFSILLFIVTLLNAGNLLNIIAVGSLNIRPDLLLIFLVFMAINCDIHDAIIASFAIGFSADISGAAMGPYIISFGIVGAFVAQLRKAVQMKTFFTRAFVIFIASLISGTLAYILIYFKLEESSSKVLIVLIARTFYSAAAGGFLWVPLSTLSKWIGVLDYRHIQSRSRTIR